MFVDQVDSTRLLAQIGDQAMVEVRHRLHDLMSDAVARHDGRIFGDMGDGVAAAFSNPTAAARAALDMQQNADATRLGDKPPIELRVGVHHGEVVPNGDGFIGMSVHVAARLCDAAPNGHVAASEAFCAALDLSDHDVKVTPYERRVMKGIAEPIDVSLLIHPERTHPVPSPLASSRWQIPSTPWLTERTAPRLMVGRKAEQLELDEVTRRSREQVQLALVNGEPGIGKSTLLHDCGSRFAEQRHLCVIGRADESQPSPYREFIEALAHVVPHLPDTVVADHVDRHGHLLARLVPSLGQRVPSLDRASSSGRSEPERFRLFEAIADLLRTITSHQPMVMLIEDLHWSAEPSLALLQHLTRSVQLPSLTLVASFRPYELHGTSPLADFLARVATDENVTRLHLEPLRPADVEMMVAHLPFADVAGELHEKTSGSPLFLTEMIRSFGESGEPALTPEGSLVVPDTVQELATSRIDRLGPSHRAVLADAALLGSVFELTDLERLSPSHIDVLATLEEAEQAGIVITDPVDDEAFVFGHAVVRDALYGRISAPRRRRRHHAAADALLASGRDRIADRAVEILRHIDLSGNKRSPDLMAELAGFAAERSMLRLDLSATAHYRQLVVDALSERADPSDDGQAELVDALLLLAGAQTAAGRNRGRKTFVDAAALARSIGRWDLFSEAAAGYGGPLKENQAIRDVSEPQALITEALKHEPEATARRARLLTALAIWQRQHVPYADRRPLADEAIRIARSIEDKHTLATVLAEVHRGLHGPNATNEALEASHEIEHLAAELGDDLVVLQAVNLRLHCEYELGAWDRVAEQAALLDQLAERIGTIEGKRICLLWRSTLASLQGDAEGRQTALDELNALIAAFPPGARALMIGASTMILPLLQGHAELLYEFGKDISPPFVKALFAIESGNLELAERHIIEGGGPERVLADQNYLFFVDAVAMTRTARRSADTELAQKVYDLLLPYAGRNARMGVVSFLGAVHHHLGTLASVLGRFDDAADHFAAALEQHRSMGARPWTALTLAEFAAVTDQADDRQAMISEASALADELDLAMVNEALSRVDPGGR